MKGTVAAPLERRELMLVLPMLAVVAMLGAGIAVSTDLGLTPVLPLAVGAGLGALAVAVVSPRASVLLLVVSFGIPLFGSPFGFAIHATHLLLAVAAAHALSGVYFGRYTMPRGLLVPLGLVLMGALIASLAGPFPGGSIYRLANLLLLPLATAIVAAVLIDPRRDLLPIALALAATVAVTSGVAVLQAFGLAPGPLASEESDRVNGLFEHVNLLSGFLAPSVVLLIGVAAQPWRRMGPAPLVLVGSALLGVVALAFTLSRGALLGLAAGLLVLIGLLAARRQVVSLMAALLVIVLALTVVLPQVPLSQREQFEQRFEQLLQPGSEIGRELTFEQARLVLQDYPLTGVGPLTFGKMTRESTPVPDIEPGREHAHNLLLETWLSVGLLGLLAVAWLLTGAARRFWREIRARDGAQSMPAGWATGGIAAFAAVLVQGVGDFLFATVELLAFLMLLLGSAYALARDRGASAGHPRRRITSAPVGGARDSG